MLLNITLEDIDAQAIEGIQQMSSYAEPFLILISNDAPIAITFHFGLCMGFSQFAAWHCVISFASICLHPFSSKELTYFIHGCA